MRHLIPIIDLFFIETQIICKSQHCLQRLFKSAQTQDELDAIYEGLAERPRQRRNRIAGQKGEEHYRDLYVSVLKFHPFYLLPDCLTVIPLL